MTRIRPKHLTLLPTQPIIRNKSPLQVINISRTHHTMFSLNSNMQKTFPICNSNYSTLNTINTSPIKTRVQESNRLPWVQNTLSPEVYIQRLSSALVADLYHVRGSYTLFSTCIQGVTNVNHFRRIKWSKQEEWWKSLRSSIWAFFFLRFFLKKKDLHIEQQTLSSEWFFPFFLKMETMMSIMYMIGSYQYV